MRTEDLPEGMDTTVFLSWQGIRERLEAEVSTASGATEQYITLMLLTNVMDAQYQDVLGEIEKVKPVVANLTSLNDPGAREAEAFANWAKSWLNELQAEFDRYGQARDELSDSLPEADRIAAEEELGDRFEELKAQVRAVLGERLSELRGEHETISATAAATDAMKTCPDCAEEIKAAAKKCRYCGYRFD